LAKYSKSRRAGAELPVNILTKPFVKLKAEIPYPMQTIFGKSCFSHMKFPQTTFPRKCRYGRRKAAAAGLHARIPACVPYTERFLNYMRDTLAKNLPVETDEIVDTAKFQKMKERFYVAALELIEKESMAHSEEERKIIAGLLLQRMYGLGVVEILMSDDYLEEVSINAHHPHCRLPPEVRLAQN